VKVLIATGYEPFGPDGDLSFPEELRSAVEESGHLADLIRIPYDVSSPQRVVNDILVTRLLRIRQTADDVLITLGYPADYIHHSHKVIWMAGLASQILLAGENGTCQEEIDQGKQALREAERLGLEEAQKVFSFSRAAAEQVFEIHGLRPTVLRPPSAPDLDWPQTVAELLG